MQSVALFFYRMPLGGWLVASFALFSFTAHAQLEFSGELNVFAKTESGGQNVFATSPENGDAVLLFEGPGPHTRSVMLPEDVLSGNNGEGAAFSFAPKAKTEVTFDQGNLEVIAEASVTLNGTVPKDETAEYGYYPEASADLNMRLKDGIQIYPEDTALYGMRATVELVGEVTVSRMVIVNGSETTQAQSAVDFAVQTPPGIDNFEGALSEYREDGESEIQTDGPTNLSTPTTITLFREQAVLGPPPLDEFSSQFNNFDVDVAASARVWTSGPSGATFRAEVTMQVNNIRVNRVTLEEGGTEIALSQLKSISRSGYDWIGNGEPELQLDAFSWDNVAGGSFGEDTNWDVDAVPGSGDLAKFELPGSYTVDVGTQEVEQLRIGGDPSFNVSFNNAALTVNSTSLTPPGTIINNGIFTLSSGTVSTTHATFGSATATTVRMTGTDTTWNNTGRLNVGPIGETVFEINDGAHVTSGETFINLVDRGSISLSSISVSEFGSRWATGNSKISGELLASMEVKDGASLSGDEMQIGVQQGGGPLLRIIGKEPSGVQASELEVDFLRLGYGSYGALLIEAGGEATVSRTIIGKLGAGELAVSGEDSVFTSNFWLVIGEADLFDGPAGSEIPGGIITVYDGGKMVTGNSGALVGTLIGEKGQGFVTVSGTTENMRSTFEAKDGLIIGFSGGRTDPDFDGDFQVLDGGLLLARSIDIASQRGSSGYLLIQAESETDGQRAEAQVENDLVIGGISFDAPNTGRAVVEVLDGGLLSVGETISTGNTVTGSLIVDGLGDLDSSLAATVEAKTLYISREASGAVTVANSGRLTVDDIIFGEAILEEWSGSVYNASLNVESGGRVSALLVDMAQTFSEEGLPNYASGILVSGTSGSGPSVLAADDLLIGSANQVEVKAGGQIQSNDLNLEDGATLLIAESTEQNRSTVTVAFDLTLGGSFANPSRVNIDDNSLLEVQGNLIYTAGARMCVDGEVRTDQILPAGFFQLGCSLGTAVIDGDFILPPTGVLEVEINGTRPVDEHDMMIVTGDMEIQGTVHLIFGNYTPKQGDEIVFLDVEGNYVENGMHLVVSGLKAGFEYRLDSLDGIVSLVAETDAEALAAEDPIQFLTPRLSPDGGIDLQVYGVVGATYDFETSTDLDNWETLSSEEGANALIEFSYLDTSGERRFYRLKKTSG